MRSGALKLKNQQYFAVECQPTETAITKFGMFHSSGYTRKKINKKELIHKIFFKKIIVGWELLGCNAAMISGESGFDRDKKFD